MAQPNMLLIMADQLSALALPSCGHPAVKTPHITGWPKRASGSNNLTATALCVSGRGLDDDRAAALAHWGDRTPPSD